MATAVKINGYGQVELNNVAFRRDGRIEAQCKPNAANFTNKKVENGMLLAVDNVAREVKLPTDAKLPIALVYSTEHMYDERANGLKDFALNGTGDFLPRLGYLSIGDKFHSNCLATANGKMGTLVDDLVGKPAFGGIDGETGRILISNTAPTKGPVLKVIEKATMPDGQFGLKFQVIDIIVEPNSGLGA